MIPLIRYPSRKQGPARFMALQGLFTSVMALSRTTRMSGENLVSSSKTAWDAPVMPACGPQGLIRRGWTVRQSRRHNNIHRIVPGTGFPGPVTRFRRRFVPPFHVPLLFVCEYSLSISLQKQGARPLGRTPKNQSISRTRLTAPTTSSTTAPSISMRS